LQPIAIIGAACRFPGATGLDEFWQLLRDGRSAIVTVPKERWDLDAFYDPNPNAPGKMASRFGGFVKGIKEFDHAFFGISPREATSMDPQQRMLLETAWEAFEDAGVPMDSLAGSKTAVYVGIGPGDYSRLCMQPADQIDAYLTTGNFLSVAADRIAYFFDLRGPSLAVDTACSSSLVCVHLACRSIEYGETTMALAGGVNALISPPISISLSKAGAISPTGQCRAFDGQADGYVRGEGAGFVVLKRLQDAVADGDRIYAVLRGSAINQSGRRNGLTAPGSWGEEAVMVSAWQAGSIAPAEAEYVEAHGTGTVLGDAIEAGALGKVFGSQRNGHGPCRIGSVKTNIGHLETAAGVAGLIKVLLMMWHGEFVGSLYPETPNPHVNLENLGLRVQKHPERWSPSANSRRTAGVSSFGLGGTYAHLCVTSPEVATADETADAHPTGFLVPVSARHPDALRLLVRDFSRLLDQPGEGHAIEICRAAARRRTHHDYRVAFAGSSSAEVALAMDWWLQHPEAGTSKVGPRRKLVVVIASCGLADAEVLTTFCSGGVDHAEIQNQAVSLGDRGLMAPLTLLGILSYWGIRSHRVFQLRGRDALFELSGNVRSSDQRQISWEELRNAGDDFLDLTVKDSLAPLSPLRGNGRIISGFASSEDPTLTAFRLAGELYELGHPLAWQNIYPGTVRHVSLPRYPWQQKTCWWAHESSPPPSQVKSVAPVSPATVNPPPAMPDDALRSLLARVTGRPLQEIQADAVPSELGIDSLMITDLQSALERQFGVTMPLETLLQAGSVRELERLVGQVRGNAVQGQEIQSPQVTASSRPAIEIREAALPDYAQIAALSARNGLHTKIRDEWEHLWINNPVYKRFPHWPVGWVVQNGEDIVGFLGNIPVSYSFRGREVIGASLHSFSLDSSYRSHGPLLLQRMLECDSAVEYLVGTTANASSSKLLARSKIPRVPVGDWENSAFWITNYPGFVACALAKKGWPKLLTHLGAAALKIADRCFRPRSLMMRQSSELNVRSSFDERFDVFWDELQRAHPNRFLATRSREVLQWHFQHSLTREKAWIVTWEEKSRLLAYAVFCRCDNPEIGLTRIRLVDFQVLDQGFNALVPMLAWGVGKCREEGVHILESFGFHPEKQRVIGRLAPHRRRLGSWSYFYSARNNLLRQNLQDPAVWDPSLFDGDASL
jgi:3-oxoacyl-(acyl-carrier-protein) synthase/acyl carrier protein